MVGGHISLETRPEIMWAPPVELDHPSISLFQARQHYVQGAATEEIAIITLRAPDGTVAGTLTYGGDALAWIDYVPGPQAFTLLAVSGAAGYLGEVVVPLTVLNPVYHRRHRKVTLSIRAPSASNDAYIGGYCVYTVVLEATKLPPFFSRSGFVAYDSAGVQQEPPTTTPPTAALDRDGSYLDVWFRISDDYTDHAADDGDPIPPPGVLPTPQPTGTDAAYTKEAISVPIDFTDTNAVEGVDFEVLDADGVVLSPGAAVVNIAAEERSGRIRIRTLTVAGGRKYIRLAADFNGYGLQVQELPFSQMGPGSSWGVKDRAYDDAYDLAADGASSDWWVGCHNFSGAVARATLSLLITQDPAVTNPDGTAAYRFASNPAALGYGCVLRQFLGSLIGAWENVTEANLSESAALKQNHLSFYVRQGDAATFSITLLDRTKQAASDPTADKVATFQWIGGEPSVVDTQNLDGANDGAGVEVHGSPAPVGWFRCYIHYETAAGEDGDVTQYIFRPVTSYGEIDQVVDAKYTLFWGVMFERNALPGPSGMSDYQPQDHNQWHPQENCRAASTVISQYIQINSAS